MVSIKILIRRLPIRRIRREGNPTRMGGMRIVVEVSRLLGGILHIVLDVICLCDENFIGGDVH